MIISGEQNKMEVNKKIGIMSTHSGNESAFLGKRVHLSVQDEYKIYWLLITDYLRVYLSLAVTSYGYQCFT